MGIPNGLEGESELPGRVKREISYTSYLFLFYNIMISDGFPQKWNI